MKKENANNKTEQHTYKKQKLIGMTEVFDKEGNAIPTQLIQIQDKDFNFHKVWFEHLITSFDGITNQKLKLAFWIIKNLNSENQLIMTQQKIAKFSNTSYATVARTLKELQSGELPFLQKINSGAYRINPAIIWQGSHNNRMSVIYEYNTTTANNKKNKTTKENTAIDEENDSEE